MNAIDRLVDTSFAWHMVQHLVLLFVIPPLLFAVQPFRILSRRMKKQHVASLVVALRPLHALAHPVVALAIFVATMWATHFTPLYEYALEHAWAHAAEHALYLFAGIAFWLPVFCPPPVKPIPYPLRLLYLMVALPQGALLAFAIDSAQRPLYAHYALRAGASALADQHNAAAIMWIGGGLAVFTAFLITIAIWATRESTADEGNASIRGEHNVSPQHNAGQHSVSGQHNVSS